MITNLFLAGRYINISSFCNTIVRWAYIYYAVAEMDNRRQVDVAYFEFEKAFERVQNDTLLQKFADLRFAENLSFSKIFY